MVDMATQALISIAAVLVIGSAMIECGGCGTSIDVQLFRVLDVLMVGKR